MKLTLSVALALCLLLPSLAGDQRDEEVQQLMSARFAMVAKDLRIHASASEEQLENLESAFREQCDETSWEASRTHNLVGRNRATEIVDSLLQTEEWSNALGEQLSHDQRAAYYALGVDRRSALRRAQAQLLAAALATELRLREPQVHELEALATGYVQEHKPDRSPRRAKSALDQWLDTPALHDWMLLPQSQRSQRMRSTAGASATEPGSRFKHYARGRGRFAEDDFGFELDALRMFHGWDSSSTALLRDLVVRLGREEDGKRGEHPRVGAPPLFRSIVSPGDYPLWRGLLAQRLEAADSEALEPDPGPYYDGTASKTKKTLVAARVEVILSWLALRASLGEDQLPKVRAALLPFVGREYLARGEVFGAVDAAVIWRHLSMVEGRNPRKGSNSRTRLAERLTDVLDPAQEIELGLWVPGMTGMKEDKR